VLGLYKTIYRSLPSMARRWVFAVYARFVRGRVIQRDLGGYRAELHLNEIMDLAAHLGEYEPDMCQAIDALTKPGMVVVDIGANIGIHALRFASRVEATGHVYAFEATNFAFRKLTRNAALNANLKLEPIQLALSNEPASNVEVDFRSSWRTDGSRGDLGTTTVNFVRLDDWVEKHGLTALDIIKIDVDGYEAPVIQGAERTLARFRPLIMIEAWIEQYSPGLADPFALLEAAGYSLKLMVPRDRDIRASEVLPLLKKRSAAGAESFNILATPVQAAH